MSNDLKLKTWRRTCNPCQRTSLSIWAVLEHALAPPLPAAFRPSRTVCCAVVCMRCVIWMNRQWKRHQIPHTRSHTHTASRFLSLPPPPKPTALNKSEADAVKPRKTDTRRCANVNKTLTALTAQWEEEKCPGKVRQHRKTAPINTWIHYIIPSN